jgi:hypothetical protein
MPLLRRSYGHHRDLPACGSGARATIVASLYRDDCVVIRRDEPLPAVEATRLRPVGRHAHASIATSTIALMTATSACPPPSHRANAIRVNRPFRQAPPASRRSQSPRHPYGHNKTSHLCPAVRAWAVSVRRPHASRSTCEGRHPKTFTIQVIQRSPTSAPNRTFRQVRLVTEMGGIRTVCFGAIDETKRPLACQ